jgi:hypothetical protein
MEEIIRIGRKDMTALSRKMCLGLSYCQPLNSKWFKVNSIRDLNEEINMLRDTYSNAEILIMDDFDCRIGEEQVELPHHMDVSKTGMLKAVILVIKGKARTKIVMQKERI